MLYNCVISDTDVDKDSKRLRKKKLKRMILEHTATEDNSDDERIEAEVRQQAENIDVPVSLPDKAVCVQIHTGNFYKTAFINYAEHRGVV